MKLELNDNLMQVFIKALRYEYGRHSASTGDTARLMIDYLDEFDDNSLQIIYNDIEEFRGKRLLIMTASKDGKVPLEIYDHDVKPFLDLQDAVELILDERKVKPWNYCG